MPELPEVEVVRSGLEQWAVGRRLDRVEVRHSRSIRRHEAGADDLARRLQGRLIEAAQRRGKYLWLVLDDEALVIHLGMSGQVLMMPPTAPDETHLRIRFTFDDSGPQMRFVDQRTFGGVQLDALTFDDTGSRVPVSVAHIALDPLDPRFELPTVNRALRRRRTEVKRALLDQTLVSGIGNIYADEALWRSRLHGRRLTSSLTRAEVNGLLTQAEEVMTSALAQGGTSFDSLYVNVNGQSGYFSRSLEAYGQEGEPCGRCGSLIVRESFMNRSSFFCPACQRAPRRRPGLRG